MKHRIIPIVLSCAVLAAPFAADANPARDQIIAALAAESGGALSAQRGEALFQSMNTTGKPDTPSCTTCHTKDPRNIGATRAGKAIDPMAVSKTPDRFTDPAKVAKWLLRNCNTVLGRECTAQEKGDVLTYLSGL